MTDQSNLNSSVMRILQGEIKTACSAASAVDIHIRIWQQAPHEDRVRRRPFAYIHVRSYRTCGVKRSSDAKIVRVTF